MAEYLNQPSFAAGEIGPELYGRVDQELYYIGLRACRNFIVRQYGGVSNRPGSYIVSESVNSDYKTRLIPFQFNEIQTYCLQLTHNKMRVVKDGGEVLETAYTRTITGITQATEGVVTSAAHGFSNGDDVYVSGVSGMIELNARTFRVSDVAANTFKIKDFQGNYINTSGYNAYLSGGTAARIYTLATPWPESVLFDLNYAQSADVITVVHPTYPIKDITRTDHDAWTVTDFNVSEGPFKDVNVTATTIISSAVTGVVTLTASTAIFNANDVNTLIYLEQMPTDTTATWEVGKVVAAGQIRRAGFNYYSTTAGGTTGTVKPDHTEGSATDGDAGVTWTYLHSGFGIAKITAIGGGGTTATATVIKRLPDLLTTTATTNWAKAAWSATEGYPGAVSYYKQRLWFGGPTLAPNRLDCSVVGARTNFGKSKPILDDEAIVLPLDTREVNAIRHLIPLKQLIVLTSSSEQLITSADNLILATSPPGADVQGYNGSSKVHPIVIGNTAIFVEDTGDVVRSLQYDLQADAFTGIDLTARSPHLFRNKEIVDWAYQKRPLAVIWTVMDDGSLNGFTFMQEQKVYAWSRHDTDGTYESVCCIREGKETASYKMVRRLVNGTYRRYLERDASRYMASIEDAHFVDCGLSYDGRNTGATTVTVSGGTTWDNPEVLTLTASSAIFTPLDATLGNEITFVDSTAKQTYRLTISAYTSGTVVSAIPSKLVPVAYRGVARTDWRFGRKEFYNFGHLEGKEVSVLAEGNVIEGLSISNGTLTLPRPATVLHAGLPYISELETLDLAQPQGQGKAKVVNIPMLYLTVQESRAIFVATTSYGNTSQTWAGDIRARLDSDKFVEVKQRNPSTGYDPAIPAETGLFEVNTNSSWSRTGRICIRQPFPLPITINCITEEVPVGMN